MTEDRHRGGHGIEFDGAKFLAAWKGCAMGFTNETPQTIVTGCSMLNASKAKDIRNNVLGKIDWFLSPLWVFTWC
ncbi:MAG: hypothetical protein DHS20C05_05910 [Hyphococcus sp.]|nr:MAG: hypothetical protein DHS20C05_05910 [Marinicaulis sp.]